MKNIFQIIFIFNSLISFSLKADAQPGFLDPTFGNGGIVLEDRLGYAVGLSTLADGKIIVPGGLGPYFYMDRFNPDGSNDEIFGVGGRAILNLENKYAVCYCMAVQQDGKIILVGNIVEDNPYRDIAIVRCQPDGTLDSSFGINGLTTINFNNYDYAYDVAIQADGKIVVMGDFTKNLDDFFDSYILRLNTDGNLDPGFGLGGIHKIHYSLSTRNRAVAIQPDGKLLMGGLYNKYSAQPDYIVERFNTNGAVDNSFGENGTAKFNFGEGQSGDWYSVFHDMHLQSDGKIICAGESGHDPGSMALCRFNTDGSIDHSFGENGGTITEYKNVESIISSIYIQPDDKILSTGGTDNCKNLLLRYEKDGNLDLGFAVDGIQNTKIEGCSDGQYVQLLPDQKILVAGYVDGHIFLARYYGENVLAANFKEVKATQNNYAITITWQTLNEDGTKSFTVERSNNANDYVGINTVLAKGVASIYNYTDKSPLDGISYYRIRENAINGTNTFSPVVKVVFNDNGVISLYPNPAKNTVTVKGLNKNVTAVIKITDMQGREISKQNFTQSSSATLNIRAIAQGSYFVLVEQNGKVTKLRIVKE